MLMKHLVTATVLILATLQLADAKTDLHTFDPEDALFCAGSTGVTLDLLKTVSSGDPMEIYEKIPEARCFLSCVLKKMGHFVGERDEATMHKLRTQFKVVPGLDIDAIIEKCTPESNNEDDTAASSPEGEKNDGCMREYTAFMCFAEQLKIAAEELEAANNAAEQDPETSRIDGEHDQVDDDEEELNEDNKEEEKKEDKKEKKTEL